MDFATLVLGADTSGLKKGEAALTSIASTGAKTEASLVASTAKIGKGFDAVPLAADRASAGINATTATLRKLEGASTAPANSVRMLGQQLSQVAQQGAVTGNYLGALAVQLPDIALGFGSIAVAASIVTTVTMPLLIGAFGGGKTAVDSLIDANDALATSISSLRGIADNDLEAIRAKYGQIDEQLVQLLAHQRENAIMSAQTAAADAVVALSESYSGLLQMIDAGGRAGQAAQIQLRNELGLTAAQGIALRDAMQAAKDASDFTSQAAALARVDEILHQSAISGGDLSTSVTDAGLLMRAVTVAANESAIAIDAAKRAANELPPPLADALRFLGGIVNTQPGGGWLSTAISRAQQLFGMLSLNLQMSRQLAGLGTGDGAGDGRGSQREGRMGVADFQAQNALKAATARATEYRAALTGVASAGGAAGKAVGGGAKEAVKELTEAEKAAKKYAETMQGFVEGGIGKAVDWMVSGFKGGLKGLLNVFKSTISQMISYALKNKIMVSLGMGGSVAGSVASAATGGGAAGGSGMFSGIIGKIGGVFSSFISGASGLVTSLFGAGGGLGAAGTYLSSVLGGATASLGGFAAAAGAIALPLAAVVGIFSFFKKKTKELDSGMKVTVNGLNVLVETFKTIQTTKYWGLSKKVRTTVTAASEDLADPITNAFLAVRTNVVSMAKAIGVGSDALAGFTAKVSLSTKGMSQEQAQQAVLDELAKLGDQLSAKIAPPIKLFAKAGETAMETLTRLSSSLTTANDAFKALGYGLFNITIAGAGAAAKFVDLFGSLDAFKTASDFYFQNFYSLSERTRYLASQFGASLTAIGQVKVPHTVAEFRAMVDALKLAGKDKAVAELMKLAPMFTQLLELRSQVTAVGGSSESAADALARLQEILQEREGIETRLLTLQGKTGALRLRELKALDPSNQALQKMIWALEDAATAADKASAISDQRKGLEEQLLDLQGNTAELRRRELAALDPTNRALQTMIWGLEDAKKAIDALDPNNFASLFDFSKATARAGTAANTASPTIAGIAPATGSVYTAQAAPRNAEASAMVAEIRELRAQLETLMRANTAAAVATEKSTKAGTSILDKWDRQGMPATA